MAPSLCFSVNKTPPCYEAKHSLEGYEQVEAYNVRKNSTGPGDIQTRRKSKTKEKRDRM
jgi:hypothetical protein